MLVLFFLILLILFLNSKFDLLKYLDLKPASSYVNSAKLYFVEKLENKSNFTPDYECEKLIGCYDKILLLPPLFYLDKKWLDRIAEICTTNTLDKQECALSCGACTMHSAQIIAEILENANEPRKNGGYFFDSAQNTSFLSTFKQKHLKLYEKCCNMSANLCKSEKNFNKITQEVSKNDLLMFEAFLPQYKWSVLACSEFSYEKD